MSLRMMLACIQKEHSILGQQRDSLFYAVSFFTLISITFPITLGSHVSDITHIMPAVIWLALLLSICLSWPRAWIEAYQEGSLAQYCFIPLSMKTQLMIKVWTQWVWTCLPLVVMSPILAVIVGMPSAMCLPLMGSICLGSIIMTHLIAIATALTLSLRQSGLLLSLLCLPLLLPIMIFGVGILVQLLAGLPAMGAWKILIGLSCITMAATPFALEGAVRLQLGES